MNNWKRFSGHQMATGVCHDVALAAFDPVSGVVAGNAAVFSGYHALTVNNACRGLMIASVPLTRRSDRSVVDLRQ